MTNRPLHPLTKWNRRLQGESRTKYGTFLRKVCLAHPESMFSKLAYPLLRGKPKWDELLVLADSLSEQKYPDAWSHFQANQFASLIRKYPFPSKDTKHRPKEKAKENFFKAERKCKRMNEVFRARRHIHRRPLSYVAEYQRMRDFISYVLGTGPMLKHIWDKTGFGPGASIGVHGNATNVWRKLASRWSVSPGAYHYAYAAVLNHAQVREVLFQNPGGFTCCGSDYGPFSGPFSEKTVVVTHNKITFVPKTAKTHRTIAVEPLLNSFVQKGIDEHIRARLKRVGLDLSDQSRNSEWARLGSLPGAEDPFSTIDLSSASDSISIELCRELLPHDWFDFMNSVRSVNYQIDGEIRRYEKFCSMGNGFCFPLETLLFAAACHAVGAGQPGKHFLVYGDDIVVRQSVSMKLIALLAHMGFRTNSEKTFIQGPFRESCGEDWFGGVDVRPYTLDFRLDSIQSLFKLLNGCFSSEMRELFFGSLRTHMLNMVPEQFRFLRPFTGPEDTGIDTYQDEFLHSKHCSYRFKTGVGCWRWKELIARAEPDKGYRKWQVDAYALVYAALTGSASDMPFALRRKTKTKVRVVSHPGATSLWLPQG